MLECFGEEKICWQVANVRILEFGFQAEFSSVLWIEKNKQRLRSMQFGCD